MSEALSDSIYFGAALSVLTYWAGLACQRRLRHPLVNPLLISVILTISCLLALGIDYESYRLGASFLSWLLTPATVCLAIPLYEKRDQLRRHAFPILAGVCAGVLISLACVLSLCRLFGMGHEIYVTLLPKSITTAIGIGVCEELGGHVSLTVAAIVFTGVLGNMVAVYVYRWLGIDEPVARGVGLGSSAHAIGTVRAMEMGEVEGAMSSLAMTVSGIVTVALASLAAGFL